MIVKDEAQILEKALVALDKYNYEIVIVDTGSEDNTKEIAFKYTDKVYDFKWVNDFSLARNYSISKASNEYVLVVDADEVVIDLDRNVLDKNLSKEKVGRILRINKYSRDGEKFVFKERVNRLFNKSLFEYEGSIHEQLVSKNREKYSTYNVPITMEHFGYEEDEIKRKNKTKRNIELLKAELLNNGDDPYILYQLGKSYYMDKDYKKAESYFNLALEFDLDTKLEYVQDMIESLGYSLINDKRYEESTKLLSVYNEFNKSADFVFLIGLVYMNNGMFKEAIEEFKKATTFSDSKMEGVNDYLANYNIGIILECLGNTQEAISFYRKCKGYKVAEKRIKDLLA
jgi:glycosyltransferase involved in cell wall biosynthesis